MIVTNFPRIPEDTEITTVTALASANSILKGIALMLDLEAKVSTLGALISKFQRLEVQVQEAKEQLSRNKRLSPYTYKGIREEYRELTSATTSAVPTTCRLCC